MTLEKLIYSGTNNRFERVFLDIKEKHVEQRSYKMLEIKQMACYWNSNSHDNWLQNPELAEATDPNNFPVF